MLVSNELLDKSSGPDDYTRRLRDYVDSTHGKEVSDAALENADSKESYIYDLQNLANKPPVDTESHFGEFSEKNPLIKGAYEYGGKIISALDKPRSAILGPVIQAATLGHPIETAKAEFSNLAPQAESSFTGRLRELMPNQTPILDTYTKDITQGENVKAAAKMWLENRFPKAYSVASSVVPSDMAGMAMDTLTAHIIPEIPTGNLASRISNRLESAASLNREKSLINEANLSGTKAAKDIDNLKTQKIANTLERYNLDHKLSNPYELKKAISGETKLGFDQSGNEVNQEISPGVIDELGIELRMGSDHLTNKLGRVDIKEFADNVIKKMSGNYGGESSGVKFNSRDFNTLKDQVYDVLKVDQGNNYRPFDSLIDSKRNSAKYYFDLKNDPATPMVAGPSLTNTHKAIWDEIDNFVNNKALLDPDVKGFARQNSDMSDLLNAQEMLTGSRAKKLTAPGLIDIAAGTGLGYGVGNLVGKPEYGAFIGGGIGAMKGAATDIRESFPARIAVAQQNLAYKISPITGIAPTTPATASMGIIQSIPTQQQQLMMRKNFVENLGEFKIPRTVQGILDNKKLVLAKIAQATNNPQITSTLEDSLNMHPELLKSTLPALIMQFPQLFSPSKYQSWVDGKLLDPTGLEQKKAYDSIENNMNMSRTQKAMIQSGINRDGSFPEGL